MATDALRGPPQVTVPSPGPQAPVRVSCSRRRGLGPSAEVQASCVAVPFLTRCVLKCGVLKAVGPARADPWRRTRATALGRLGVGVLSAGTGHMKGSQSYGSAGPRAFWEAWRVANKLGIRLSFKVFQSQLRGVQTGEEERRVEAGRPGGGF